MNEPALKKTVKHTLVFSVWVVLNRGISLLMLPIYTRCLTPADYGILELIEMTVDIASILAGIGIISGLAKYYYQFQEKPERDELVSTLFILLIVSYLVVCLIAVQFTTNFSQLIFGTDKYGGYLNIGLLNIFLHSTICFVPLAVFRTQQRSTVFVAVSVIKLVTQLSLNILLVVYLKKGVFGVLVSNTVALLLVGVGLASYTLHSVGFKFSRQKAFLLLRFGYPFVFVNLAAFLLTFSDRYFLNYFHKSGDVGIYALAYKFGVLVQTFPMSPMLNTWMVQRFEVVRSDGYEKVFNSFLGWLALLSISSALVISILARDVLRIMATPAFWQAYRIVPVIAIAYLLQGSTDYFNFGIYQSSRTRHMAYATVLSALLIVGLSFLLIPEYGMLGAAWATLIAFAFRLAYVYFASQHFFHVTFHFGRILRIALPAVLVYFLSLGLTSVYESAPVFASLALNCGLVLLYFLLIHISGVLTPSERKAIAQFLRSPRESLTALRR